MRAALLAAGTLALACGGTAHPAARPGPAPISRAADRAMVCLPPARVVLGSSAAEREQAYRDAAATAGTDAARRAGWFDREAAPHVVAVAAFCLDRTPVTQAAYAEWVAQGGTAPTIDRAGWRAQHLIQDFDREVARFVWRDRRPPPGRAAHPVVLETFAEAQAYCAWRGRLVGAARRLPSADEYERAVRGDDGRTYPWGAAFDPAQLDGAVGGPRDTVPVGSYPPGPYGLVDLAGEVFEWTATPWPGTAMRTVKGSAWDDDAGVGRAAAQHGRPEALRHVLLGFRCASDR